MNKNENPSINNSSDSKVVLATKSEIKVNIDKILKQEEHYRLNREKLVNNLINELKNNNSSIKDEQIVILVSYFHFKKLIHNEISFIIKSSFSIDNDKLRSLCDPIFKMDKSKLSKTKELRKAFLKDTANIIVENIKEIKNIDSGKYLKKFVDGKIYNILENDGQPPAKLLIESIEQYTDLYFDNSTLKYYAKVKNKEGKEQLRQISNNDITSYCNEAFGPNKINSDICLRVFKFITRDIEKDYSLLEFTNGSLKLDNNDYKFFENEFFNDRIPKIVFPFEWNPIFEDDEENKIENLINDILKCDDFGFEENIDNFYKCVANACMPVNSQHVFTIFLGSPGTGKSTILTMLKRIFEFSEVPIPDIIKNERFALTPAVDKDINIDDDLQTESWKNIGKLNTFVSGNGIQVEVKGKNGRIFLNQYSTPKLFGSTNTLPKVKGMGYKRRLILIKAENKVSEDKKDDTLQYDITNGKYDKGLAKLIYKSINLFYDNRNNLFSEESRKAMLDEWDLRADPLNYVIDKFFKVPNTDELFSGKCRDIPVSEVNDMIKMFLRDLFDKGRIDSIHANPSLHKIKKAMLDKGFIQGKIAIVNDDDNPSTISVYKDVLEKGSNDIKDNNEEKYDEDILI